MEHKTFELIDVKADGDAGTFTALASVFGNVDRVGDRMLPGSFTKTLDTWRQSGKPLPVILSHNWDDPHKYVGEADPRAVYESDQGLVVQGKMYTDEPLGGKVYELMKRGILTGWSFGYKVPKGGQQKKDGVNDISEVELFEVGPTLVGANPDAQLQEIKSALALEPDMVISDEVWHHGKAEEPKPGDEEPEPIAAEKAVWSTAFINDLPDSSFLYIESGGTKDSDGKTTPRSLRHFPVKNVDGTVDMPHLRNALSRIPQSNLPDSVKARATAAAQRMMGSNRGASVDPLKQESRDAVMGVMRDGATAGAAKEVKTELLPVMDSFEEELKAMRNEFEGDMAELREAVEKLQIGRTSEDARNKEPKRAKSPPDPLRKESRDAVLKVIQDGVPTNIEPVVEPEPEPEMSKRELRRMSRQATLSVLKGGLDG